MKKAALTFALLLNLIFTASYGQQIPGLENSNYGGIYRATYNPSIIGGPRHKWQINIGTLGGSINYRYFRFVGENSLLYPLLAPRSTKELYGRSRTMGSLTYKDPVYLVSEIRWPSAMIALGKYQGLALQFRTRGYAKASNIPEPIQNLYFYRLDTGGTPDINNQQWGDFSLVQQSYSDVSLTYGAQLLDFDSHKLRIGGTIKRVFGARIGFVVGSADSYSLNPVAANSESSELTISNLSYQSGYSAPTRKNGLGNLFNADKTGAGWAYDLGASYELGSYWGKSKEVYDESPEYLIRLGASLTDVGSIKYRTADSRVISGRAAESVIGQQQLETISDRGPEGFMSLFPAENDSIFRRDVQLAQAVHFEADIQLVKGFFLTLSKTKRFKSRDGQPLDVYMPNSFTITPRFEDEDSDFAFPITFIQGNNRPSIGAMGHFGPIFLGFSSVNGLMKKGGARGSMVYIGFTAWKLYRNKDKE
ncbi:DUF5723 family protein [Dyadobacter arcticus]|uniref:DUF5723 domain-containing protein n=1 Tax=Dyadobacter arcticus TaxID=1078754 RepID=A0ABX0UCU9_9BACT|nr:DUF5723 family protein [Dyadobacter arcticus]NIJ50854.1 hypothetical protein [Dyadobacter arcticus]